MSEIKSSLGGKFTWAVNREKVPNVLSGHARSSFFWYDNHFLEFVFGKKFFGIFFFFFFWKFGVIPKEGWVRPHTPVLLLVWPQLRPLGTFSHNAAHIWNVLNVWPIWMVKLHTSPVEEIWFVLTGFSPRRSVFSRLLLLLKPGHVHSVTPTHLPKYKQKTLHISIPLVSQLVYFLIFLFWFQNPSSKTQ